MRHIIEYMMEKYYILSGHNIFLRLVHTLGLTNNSTPNDHQGQAHSRFLTACQTQPY